MNELLAWYGYDKVESSGGDQSLSPDELVRKRSPSLASKALELKVSGFTNAVTDICHYYELWHNSILLFRPTILLFLLSNRWINAGIHFSSKGQYSLWSRV